MDIQYSETASNLMEQFFLPFLLQEAEWDFSNKERDILKDVLPIMEELRVLFSPYKERIKTYYLTGYGLSLLQMCYLEMVDKGAEVTTAEEVHAYCLQLSADEICEHLKNLLNTEVEYMDKDGDFWNYLEVSNAKAETKWYFSQFYRKPVDSMKELVRLSQKLIALYQPYLEKGTAERRAYAESFSLEKIIAKSVSLAHFDWDFKENQIIKLYIISPWLVRFMSYSNDLKEHPLHIFLVSCRIDQLLQGGKELDIDTFTTALKVLSDVTRYNVLVELTKPYAKSKQIAKELDITGAAVSFHTQKLIHAKLLLFNRENENVKYDVNKGLLKELIAKLTNDFDLEDRK